MCAVPVAEPAARVTAKITAGELDGEIGRVAAYIAHIPDLVAVPTPYYTFDGRLYWLTDTAEPVGQGKVVGRLRGVFWAEMATQTLA